MLDDPSTGVSTFEYDAWDQLRVTTNAAGDSTTFTRDALGRLTSREETYADGARRTARWQWDTAISGAGRAVLGMLDSSAVDGAVPIIERIEYDELARPSGMTRELNGLPLTMTIARDGEGRVTSLTYPTAISDTPYAVAFDYEPRSGQLVRVHRGEHALWDLRAENARGEPTVELLGPIGRVTSYTPGGRMETLRSGMAGPEPVALQELTYEYASRGLLTGRTNALTGRHESMEHDSLGRLISLTTTDASSSRTQGFKIDGLGNLRAAGEEQIRFDDASHPQLATMYQQGGSALWEELAYDEAGRVVTATTGAGARQYTWNADDLPRHVEDPSVGAVDFSYTADGERAAKVGPGGDLTGYVAGLYEVSRRGMDVVERYYVPTPAGVVASVERRSGEGGVSDTERWLLTDYQGSVETTWVRGQAPEHVLYDPFGGVVDAGGVVEDRTPTPDATHGYTGHEHDGELGLVNMGGRIYDPRIRRFLTGDPLLAPGTQGLNRYAYVHNRPFDATDPSGWQARSADDASAPATTPHTVIDFAVGSTVTVERPGHEVTTGAGAHGDGGGGSDSSTGEQAESSATGSDPGPAAASGQLSLIEQTGVRASVRDDFDLGVADGLLGGVLEMVTTSPVTPDAFRWESSRSGAAQAGRLFGSLLGLVTDAELFTGATGGGAALAGPTGGAVVVPAAAIATVAVAAGALHAHELEVALSGPSYMSGSGPPPSGPPASPPLNRAGRPYPSVSNPGTGERIPYPGDGLQRVPGAQRVPWGPQERGAFIAEWYRRGLPTPPGGWAAYDIHHIVPREFGGTNAFENLVPVERSVHQSEFNAFWRDY